MQNLECNYRIKVIDTSNIIKNLYWGGWFTLWAELVCRSIELLLLFLCQIRGKKVLLKHLSPKQFNIFMKHWTLMWGRNHRCLISYLGLWHTFHLRWVRTMHICLDVAILLSVLNVLTMLWWGRSMMYDDFEFRLHKCFTLVLDHLICDILQSEATRNVGYRDSTRMSETLRSWFN